MIFECEVNDESGSYEKKKKVMTDKEWNRYRIRLVNQKVSAMTYILDFALMASHRDKTTWPRRAVPSQVPASCKEMNLDGDKTCQEMLDFSAAESPNATPQQREIIGDRSDENDEHSCALAS